MLAQFELSYILGYNVSVYTVFTTAQFDDWFGGLKDRVGKTRIQARIDRMEDGNLGDCKSVGKRVSEARLDFGHGYRIYFSRRDFEIIVLLCGGDKSSQIRDIKAALAIATQLKETQP